MDDLDEFWSQMLAAASTRARVEGRHDVADYLELKASNDQIREQGVGWLFDSVISLAADANRRMPAIVIEREEPHQFSFLGANMVGRLLRVRHGIRCLTLEAGWTRTPSDGFMRGGALAFARIIHFGVKNKNADLCLVRLDESIQWMAINDRTLIETVDEAALDRHFKVFLGF